VLKALATRIQKIHIHRRCVVALLDELDLEITRIAERNAHLDGGRLALISEPVALDAVDIVEGADAKDFRPVFQAASMSRTA